MLQANVCDIDRDVSIAVKEGLRPAQSTLSVSTQQLALFAGRQTLVSMSVSISRTISITMSISIADLGVKIAVEVGCDSELALEVSLHLASHL